MLKLVSGGLSLTALAMAGTALAHDHGSHSVDADYAIAASALALPTSMQGDASVRLEGEDGEMTWAHEGSNGLTCTVSNMSSEETPNRLSVACMPAAIVAMGSAMDEIRSSTNSREEYMAAVTEAIEAGTLTPPAAGTTGYLWRGEAETWGASLDDVEGDGWQVVFTPFATAAELNLPDAGDGTMPWVMASGTPFAHIMVFGSTE